MKNVVKGVLYWCTVIPPIFDFAVGTVRGIYSSVKNFKAWLNQYSADTLNKKIGKEFGELVSTDENLDYQSNLKLTEKAIKNNILDPKDL